MLRASRRHPRLLLVLPAVALTIAVVGSAAPASAHTPSGYPGRHDVENARSAARAAVAEVQGIAHVVIGLQHRADAAGRTAQIADERYVHAKALARAEQKAAATAKANAAAARDRAVASRLRAGAVAGSLARTDLRTLPLGLMLSPKDAGGLLRGLSTVSVLAVDSQQVYRRAAQDEFAAEQASAEAATAEAAAASRSKAAELARTAALHQARRAVKAVAEQQQRELDLIARIARLRRTSEKAACDYLAGLAHRPRCGTPGGAALAEANTPALKAVAFARKQIGEPYVLGAAGPSAWDCSGLTMAAYASVGISIGIHSATAQYALAQHTGRLVPLDQLRPGDLLFYSQGRGDMYHTAIYSGDGLMIEAPYAGAVVREVPVRGEELVGQVARPAR